MNNGRNASERSAISGLQRLLDPDMERSPFQRRTQVNTVVRHIVDAAMTQIRKEIRQERTETVINAAIFDIQGDETPATIVAKKLERDGKRLPDPPTYERGADG